MHCQANPKFSITKCKFCYISIAALTQLVHLVFCIVYKLTNAMGIVLECSCQLIGQRLLARDENVVTCFMYETLHVLGVTVRVALIRQNEQRTTYGLTIFRIYMED